MSKSVKDTPTETETPAVELTWQDPQHDAAAVPDLASVAEDQAAFARLIAAAAVERSEVSDDDWAAPVRSDAEKEAARVRLVAAQNDVQVADDLVTAAAATMEAAAEKVVVAERVVIDLTEEFIHPPAAIPDGESALAPSRVRPARDAVEQAEQDAKWYTIERAAAEAEYSRAVDRAARAQRAVKAEEYLTAYAEHHDPNNRITQLRKQLSSTIFELIPLLQQRRVTHDVLAREFAAWPADERRALNIAPGRALQDFTSDSEHIVAQTIPLPVPFHEVRNAIMAGVQAAVIAGEGEGSSNEMTDPATPLQQATNEMADPATSLRSAESWLRAHGLA